MMQVICLCPSKVPARLQTHEIRTGGNTSIDSFPQKTRVRIITQQTEKIQETKVTVGTYPFVRKILLTKGYVPAVT